MTNALILEYLLIHVVADTMSTEVIDKSQSKEEIHQELASIQVLARLSLGFAIFIMVCHDWIITHHRNHH
jgi:hypothetical protein